MLRLLDSLDQPVEQGWQIVRSPLGASLVVHVDSTELEMCETWKTLPNVSGSSVGCDPKVWFKPHELAAAHQGLVAEFYASSRMLDKFMLIVRDDEVARNHILGLPTHILDNTPVDWELVEKCIDLARVASTNHAARDALKEALGPD